MPELGLATLTIALSLFSFSIIPALDSSLAMSIVNAIGAVILRMLIVNVSL